jgi:hypothetical protein
MTALEPGDRFYHRGFREFGIYHGTDELSDPSMRTGHVKFDDGRETMSFRYLMEPVCCNSHNRHCEPPGDLCCHQCSEAGHDTFPIRHADGSRCIMGQP